MKGLLGGAILLFSILALVSNFAFKSHSVFWIVITIIIDLLLGSIGLAMILTLWKEGTKIYAQSRISRAYKNLSCPKSTNHQNCKRCKKETGYGRVYKYYYGNELGAHNYRYSNRITMVENYRIDGSGQGFLCNKCVLRSYYKREKFMYYFFMVLLSIGIGIFYAWLVWKEGLSIWTLPYAMAAIIVGNGIFYLFKTSNDKKIRAVEQDDENFMEAAITKDENGTSSNREIQRHGDIVLMEVLNPDIEFAPDTAASLRCNGRKVDGKLILAGVNVYYITQYLYDDFKQLGKIK
jgi:hypothetical protein